MIFLNQINFRMPIEHSPKRQETKTTSAIRTACWDPVEIRGRKHQNPTEISIQAMIPSLLMSGNTIRIRMCENGIRFIRYNVIHVYSSTIIIICYYAWCYLLPSVLVKLMKSFECNECLL